MLESSQNGALDELDRVILAELQSEGRITNAELARRVKLSPPAIHARIRRLEEAGYIRRYVALLEPELMGYDVTCFVHIALQLHDGEQIAAVRAALLAMAEVLECHHVTGEFDYALKIVARDRRALESFLVDRLATLPGLARMQTSMVLNEVKYTTQLPILRQADSARREQGA